jgi:hypothetical protein
MISEWMSSIYFFWFFCTIVMIVTLLPHIFQLSSKFFTWQKNVSIWVSCMVKSIEIKSVSFHCDKIHDTRISFYFWVAYCRIVCVSFMANAYTKFHISFKFSFSSIQIQVSTFMSIFPCWLRNCEFVNMECYSFKLHLFCPCLF